MFPTGKETIVDGAGPVAWIVSLALQQRAACKRKAFQKL